MNFDLFYTLHVSLSGSDPLIWRRIEVPGVCPLNEFGWFVMRSMDWDGTHLWEFLIGGKRYRDEEDRYPWLQDVAVEGDIFTNETKPHPSGRTQSGSQ